MASRVVRLLPLLLGLGLGVLGCKNGCGGGAPVASSDAGEAPASAEAGAVAAASGSAAPKTTRVPRGAGYAGAFFDGTTSANLDDAQKAKVEEIQKRLPEAPARTPEWMKSWSTDVTASVKAGKMDMAKLEPQLAALEKASAEHDQKLLAALAELHSILSPAQRAAVVGRVKIREARREARGMRKGKTDGVTHEVGAQRRAVDRMVRGIDLDDAQKKKVEAIAPKIDGADGGAGKPRDGERLEAILKAFEEPTFDPKKFPFDAKKVRAAEDEQLKLLGQVVAILKPEQREKLAAAMERRASGVGAFGRRVEAGPRFVPPPPEEQDDDTP